MIAFFHFLRHLVSQQPYGTWTKLHTSHEPSPRNAGIFCNERERESSDGQQNEKPGEETGRKRETEERPG